MGTCQTVGFLVILAVYIDGALAFYSSAIHKPIQDTGSEGEEIDNGIQSQLDANFLRKCPSLYSEGKPEIKLRIWGPGNTDTVVKPTNWISLSSGVMVLKCLARSPITVTFQGLMAKKILVRKFRSLWGSRDNGEDYCYRIHMSIILSSSATGLYECSTSNSSSSLYIFADREHMPHLLLAEHKEPIPIRVHTHLGNPLEDVILPCVTNNPAVKINLFKDGQKLMSSRNEANYNPPQGFTLRNFSCGESLYENYTCTLAANFPRWRVTIQVKCVEFNESTSMADARFENRKYTDGNQTLVEYRCLNSTRMNAVSCESLEECEFLKACGKYPFQSICKTEQIINSCETGNSIPNCLSIRTSAQDKFRGMIFCSNPQTTDIGKMFSDVTGRKAWNIDYETGISAPKRPPQYNKWLSVISTDFNTLNNVDSFIQYETYGFQCNASQALSAEGMEWIFQLKNGSLIPADTLEDQFNRSNSLYIKSSQISFNHIEIEKLICRAPIFYSKAWVNFSHPVTVSAYTPAEVQIWGNETRMVYTNQTIDLTCSAYGSRVAFSWRKNDLKIPGPTHIWIRRKPSSRVIYSTIAISYDSNTTTPLGSVDNYSCLTHDIVTNQIHTTFYWITWINPGPIFVKESPDSVIQYWIVVVVPSFFLVVFITTLALGYKYGKVIFIYLELRKEKILFRQGDPKLVGKLEGNPYDDGFEIKNPGRNLVLGQFLNKGHFGTVSKATLTINGKDPENVVVKTLLPGFDTLDLKNFLKEIKISQKPKHEHIVKCYGAVTKGVFRLRNRQKPQLVFEFLCYGDVETALRRLHINDFQDQINPRRKRDSYVLSREDPAFPFERLPAISTSTLLEWCGQVANGMDYLNEVIVHRDLAARNVFITKSDSGQLIAKIGDFGLSRILHKVVEHDITYYIHKSPSSPGDILMQRKHKEEMPPRWLAIEVLEALVNDEKDKKYSKYSDVWAFGVFVWEVFTLCEDILYENEIPSNDNIEEELMDFLNTGERLKQPFYANSEIYEIMMKCWIRDKEERPSFLKLQELLLDAEKHCSM